MLLPVLLLPPLVILLLIPLLVARYVSLVLDAVEEGVLQSHLTLDALVGIELQQRTKQIQSILVAAGIQSFQVLYEMRGVACQLRHNIITTINMFAHVP